MIFGLLFVFLSPVASELIGSFIVPHGSVILNYEEFKKSEPKLYDMTKEIHLNYAKFGSIIRSMNPDVVLITTPHGMALENFFGVYMNELGQGTGSSNEGSYKKYSVNVTLDYEFSTNFYETVSKKYDKLEGIVSSSEEMEFPLAWGACIPQWFIETIGDKKTYGGKYSVLSFPRRRLKEEVEMMDEMLRLGGTVYEFLESSKKKVILLISGDLSHCHKNEFGPNPYPIRPLIAKEYDSDIENWVKTQNSDFLLKNATSIATSALSCGYTEFMMLQGLLNEAKQKYDISTKIIQPPSAPTYFGMMIAQYMFETKRI